MKSLLSLIIPCYNEEEGISHLAEKINPVLAEIEKKFSLELIFVDDGSKDRTFELLNQYFGSRPGTKIIRHGQNQNLGAAMRTGFLAAAGDLVATMDSDCTYDPQSLLAMVGLLDEKTSVVTASPYHPQGGVKNVPAYRLFLSKGIAQLYRLATGINIHTFTALFRVYRKDVVKSVSFHSPDFLATAEILINAHAAGHTIREYPAVLHVREYGVSKIRLLRVMKSHAQYLVKIFWRKLIGSLRHKA